MASFYLIFLLGLKVATANYLGEKFWVTSSPKVYSKSLEWYLSQETNLTNNCYAQLIDLVFDLKNKRRWALEMFDATGKLPSGILSGNFAEMGSFDECIDIDEHRKDNMSVTGKYCLGSLAIASNYIKKLEHIPSYMQVPSSMRFSVCFPNSCTPHDIEETASAIGLSLLVKEEDCQTKETQAVVTKGGYATMSLTVVALALMIASTIYELVLKEKSHWALKSFSVWSNWKLLFNMGRERDPSEITCFYGYRILALASLMLSNVYFFRYLNPIADTYEFYEWRSNIKNFFLYNPVLAIDVFFFISGCLVSYTFLKKSSKNYEFSVIFYYLGRYMRHTPALIVVLLFAITWFEYVGSGPIWQETSYAVEQCRTHWWSFLLYIQNFTWTLCVPPTWYFSIDCQLIFLSPILLLPLQYSPKVTIWVTAFLALLSVIGSFAVAWVLKLSADLFSLDKNYYYFYVFFLPTKASTWLIGFILGYFLFTLEGKEEKTTMKKSLTIFLLILALIVMIICILGTYHITIIPYKQMENSLALTLIRPAFAISLAYITYACHIGRGGIVNMVLSNPVFETLSRLTYNMYLIHYFIVIYNVYSIRVVPFVNNYSFLVNDLPGCFFLSAIAAILLSLFFEIPIQHFVNYLFEWNK